eukprot:TRINITY_DN104350_c0_g1_i1.p1 TRINITY_DN104350_c0_g1~~TRINITY_DN104350_c0_g1_i1.p1  ORF type:complete len:904 (-),score=143.92 TRINITY_DN104350_c0_g1_i1:20-2710(-)
MGTSVANDDLLGVLTGCLARLDEVEAWVQGASRAESYLAEMRSMFTSLCKVGPSHEMTTHQLAEQKSTAGDWPACSRPSLSALKGVTGGGEQSATKEEAVAANQSSILRRVQVDQVVLETLQHETPRLLLPSQQTPELHVDHGQPSQDSRRKAQKVVDVLTASYIRGHRSTQKKTPVKIVAASKKPNFVWRDAFQGKSKGKARSKLQVPVLFPESKYRILWDVVGLVFIIYETWALPYTICFDAEPEEGTFAFLLASLVNLYFIINIGASFLVGFRDKDNDNMLIMDLPAIRRNYVRGWFFWDTVGAIPWEWMNSLVDTHTTWSHVTQSFRLLRLLRAARLLKLLHVDVFPDRAKMFVEGHPVIGFIIGVMKVLFVLFGVTHWAACAWFLIGSQVHGHGENTWVEKNLEGVTGKAKLYTYSLYFTLTTMTTVGYGDITPQNYEEVLFASCLLFVAALVFPMLMGALTDLFSALHAGQKEQSENIRVLSSYLHWRKVDLSLFMKIRAHLLYFWETNQGFDAFEEKLLNVELPPILRSELRYHLYGSTLKQSPFLAFIAPYDTCLKELSNILVHQILCTGDSIFRIGEPNVQVFILTEGKVRLSLNERIFNVRDDEEEGDDEEVITKAIAKEAEEAAWKLPEQSKAEECKGDPNTKRKDLLQASVLVAAAQEMAEEDVRLQTCAKQIQRRWRARKWVGTISHKDHPAVRSKSIEHPAYFGESCLWEPLKDWDTQGAHTLRHLYSARCEKRVIILSIARADLKKVIEKFGPWLEHRFESFREKVLRHLQHAERQRRQQRQGAQDSPGRVDPVQHVRTDMAAADLLQRDQGYSYAQRQLRLITLRGRQHAARLSPERRRPMSLTSKQKTRADMWQGENDDSVSSLQVPLLSTQTALTQAG